MNPRILIVDAEQALRDSIGNSLRQAGFEIRTAASCQEALGLVTKNELELLIVGLVKSDLKNYEVCRLIRESPNVRTVPMLVISGDRTEGIVANCLNSGADGFIPNDTDDSELIAHVRALLRRSRIYLWDDDSLEKGRLVIKRAERRVFIDDKEIPMLTPKEYALLHELVMNSPNVVDRNHLVSKVWGISFDQLGRKTLDVHIQRIRRKLGSAANGLKTISLVGYRWSDQPNP